jgi:hypothetical protein
MIYNLLNHLLNDLPLQIPVGAGLVTSRAGDHEGRPYKLKTPLSMIQIGRVHGMDRKVTFLVFEKGNHRPAVIFKVTRSPDYRLKLQREYNRLIEAFSLRAIRQTIPKPLGIFEANGYLVMVESFVPGIPLSLLLRRRERTRPVQIEEDLECAELWLHDFQDSGGTDHTNWSSTDLEYEMKSLSPDRLFRRKMLDTARHFDGLTLLLKPSHGDFWPGNFLMNGRSIGVVDWENFQIKAWPLRDAFLFITAYARNYPWHSWKLLPRSDSFRRAFLESNWFSQIIKEYVRRALLQANIPAEAAHLLFFHFLLTMAREEGEKPDVAEGQWHEYLRIYQSAEERSVLQEIQ